MKSRFEKERFLNRYNGQKFKSYQIEKNQTVVHKMANLSIPLAITIGCSILMTIMLMYACFLMLSPSKMRHRAFDLEKKLKYKIKKKNNSIRNKLVKLNKKRKYHHPYYVENTPEIYNEDQYKHDLSIEKQQRAPSTAKYFHQTQATVPIVKNNLQKDERFMKNLSEATEALNQSLYDNSMPSNLSIESEYEQIQSRMGVHQFWKKKDVDEIKMKNSQHLTNDQRPVPRPTNFLEELKLYHNRMKK
ncbi:MAG: hypothetical protein MHPSP_002266 [Paramarteilia canceri]